MFKSIKYIMVTFFVCVSLQILAYCIPSDAIANNITESSNTLKNGGVYTVAPEYYSMRIDTFTDAWMLDIAAWSGNEPILQKAFGSYYYDFSQIHDEVGGSGPWTALEKISAGNGDLPRGSYARYWHGYIFFLRLALMAMDYTDIRVINSILLLLLSFYLFYVLTQEKKECCFPFVCFLIILCPLSAFFCMAYTGVIFLSLISSIFLIKFKFVKHNFSFSELYPIYIIIGMLTSWIDILSFPLITLGVPLIFTISFIDSTSYKEAIWRVLKLSIYWGLGYAGMWIMKWVLSSIILNVNVISDAIGAARIRSSAKAGDLIQDISTMDVILQTWKVICKKPYIIFYVVSILTACLQFMRIEKKAIDKKRVSSLLVVSFYPIAWCFLMKNHTYGHFLFTFRIWGISIFALTLIPCMYLSGSKKLYK